MTAREMLQAILNDLTDEQCEEALAVWEAAGIGTAGSV